MSKQEEFYRWWATLTQEQRIGCWYDLDAMAHGEVVSSLRSQLVSALQRSEAAERERVDLCACIVAADEMRACHPDEYKRARVAALDYDEARCVVFLDATSTVKP